MGLWRCAFIAALLLAAPMARAAPLAQAAVQAANDEPARLALVIGNADYNLDGKLDTPESVSQQGGYAVDLPNTVNDAADMKDSLERLHFKVTEVTNASLSDMNFALAKFGADVKAAGPNTIVVVYYSGHGIEVGGETYLIPAGAKLPMNQDLSAMDAEGQKLVIQGYAEPLGNIFQQLRVPGQSGMNLIILDACRDNPWEALLYGAHKGIDGRTNLPAASTSLPRTVIAFATSPGAEASDGKGRHSPYTETLLAWIESPNMSVLDMLDQVGTDVGKMTGQTPWLNLSSISRICLAGCSDHAVQSRAVIAQKTVQTAPAVASEPAHDATDDSDFKAALDKATAEDLMAYAIAHPDSANTKTALRLIKAMKNAAPTNNQSAPAKTDNPGAKESGPVRQTTSKPNGDH
ncbi:MAG TPA: caspase family protein [Caulobacteraceae bacterium]|jgi:uncharacterized caspase-like protein|nr:caspase family protein [Caulobacteraceae bacterium]